MSNARLLDRQIGLLEYLTSAEGIFGEDPPADPMLRGFDPGRLRVEAEMSYIKRMAKVRGTFPETFTRMEKDRADALLRGFARAYPPDDIGRYHNARQFLEFLEGLSTREPPEPAYLLDVARFEFALVNARMHDDEVPGHPGPDAGPSICRHVAVSLVPCGHDIRPLFDGSADDAAPETRETFLVVRPAADGDEPRILEISPALFRLLQALDDWTSVAEFAAAAGDDAAPLLDELVARDLLHVAT